MKPTTLRALLYTSAAFLLPWTEKVVPILMDNKWPTPQSCIGVGILGLVAAIITLRAYVDGSAERSKTNGGTAFIAKTSVLVLAALTLTGCTQPYTVAPGADAVVVHAEAIAETAVIRLDAFVAWERRNEAALLKVSPDIHAAADLMREVAPQAIRDLRAATKLYKQNRGPENKDKLNGALKALEYILLTTQTYYQKGAL